ncbi:hypothetical protein P12x_000553 [Tundrisphaera lichenicola]|uniref:hypothetical protein n=1 Tax=Tundrisphaera lichenicola TaxID=2029860 RepID=UPI003EC0C9E9
MHPQVLHARSGRGRVTILTLALVVLWGGTGTMASASSISSNEGRPSAHGGHKCRCGMDCGDTCCCAPEDHADLSPEPPRPSGPTPGVVPITGPCMASAPCGGALPPGSGPIAVVGDPADLPSLTPLLPLPARSWMGPPNSDRAEPLPGSRLDEPPERLADA